jgi:hypothetical protein
MGDQRSIRVKGRHTYDLHSSTAAISLVVGSHIEPWVTRGLRVNGRHTYDLHSSTAAISLVVGSHNHG